jgi:hypothetical protein
VVSFTPNPFYSQEKSPRYPLDRRLGGPQSRSGRRGEEKILDHTRTRTPTPRLSSPWPVAIPTTLSLRTFIYACEKKGSEIASIQTPARSIPQTTVQLLTIIKESVCLIKNHAVRAYWGREGIAYAFLISALGDEWTTSRFGLLLYGKWLPISIK